MGMDVVAASALIASAIAQHDRDHPDGISSYGFDFLSSQPAG